MQPDQSGRNIVAVCFAHTFKSLKRRKQKPNSFELGFWWRSIRDSPYSDCYQRSIACSVTLVTDVQFCTGAVKPPEFEPVVEIKDNRGCSA